MKHTFKRFVVVAVATAATLVAPLAVEAHFLSAAQEKEIGNQAVADFMNEYQVENNPILEHIQERIMLFNSDRLWMYGTPGKQRGIEPVRMAKHENANAISYGGGQIYVYEGMFDHLATKRSGAFSYNKDDQTPWKESNIYQMSAMAAVIGHEIAIWDNEAILNWSDQDILRRFGVCTGYGSSPPILWYNYIQKEKDPDRFSSRNLGLKSHLDADKTAMEYAMYVPEYSIGGEAMVQYREYQYKIQRGIEDKVKNWSKAKSKVTKRLKNALEYQEELSNGFVKWNGFAPTFNGDTKCGEAFLYSDTKRDFDAVERGFYVVGQIATAIHFDFCKQRNLRVEREDAVFTDGSPDNVVLLIEGHGNDIKEHTKIIDTYYGVSVEEAKYWAESPWEIISAKYEEMIKRESELANLAYTRGIVEQYESNRIKYVHKKGDE